MDNIMTYKTDELREMISKQVLDERGTGIVWMSAGNSYFKEEIIKKILDFTKANFQKTIVMAPDEPAEHTFKALGYTGNHMKKKARLNANLLQNRARRIVESLDAEEKSKFHVVEWIDEIIPNKYYKEKLVEIMSLFSTNAQFREEAYETTKSVLISKIEKGNDIDLDEAKKEGVNYLLKELAFVLASPDIFKTKRIVYIYHKDWPIYQKLIKGYYDGIVRENLGFLLFK